MRRKVALGSRHFELIKYNFTFRSYALKLKLPVYNSKCQNSGFNFFHTVVFARHKFCKEIFFFSIYIKIQNCALKLIEDRYATFDISRLKAKIHFKEVFRI